MSAKNVVLFDPLERGGMARRGAPDKNGLSPVDVIELQCPSCHSELRLDPDWIAGEAVVLCGRCETEIPLRSARRASGKRGAVR